MKSLVKNFSGLEAGRDKLGVFHFLDGRGPVGGVLDAGEPASAIRPEERPVGLEFGDERRHRRSAHSAAVS